MAETCHSSGIWWSWTIDWIRWADSELFQQLYRRQQGNRCRWQRRHRVFRWRWLGEERRCRAIFWDTSPTTILWATYCRRLILPLHPHLRQQVFWRPATQPSIAHTSTATSLTGTMILIACPMCHRHWWLLVRMGTLCTDHSQMGVHWRWTILAAAFTTIALIWRMIDR